MLQNCPENPPRSLACAIKKAMGLIATPAVEALDLPGCVAVHKEPCC